MSAPQPVEKNRRLSRLNAMPLDACEHRYVQDVLDASPEPADTPWYRKISNELGDLLKLSRLSGGRLEVVGALIVEELRIRLRLHVKCPSLCHGQVIIADEVEAQILVQRGCLWRKVNAVHVIILEPQVFHPNVFPPLPGAPLQLQPFCLGDLSRSLPLAACTSCRELVLLLYSALQMRTVTIDPENPMRVANHEAARYWLAHRDELPLDETPFLSPLNTHGKGAAQ